MEIQAPNHHQSNQYLLNQTQTLFDLLTEGEIQQIDRFLSYNPQLLETKYGPFQQTPIFYVLKVEDKKRRNYLMRALIKRGANVNAKNKIGQNVLFYAAAKLQQQQCRLLLQSGADATIVDDLGKMALEYAEQLGIHKNAQIIQFYMKVQSPNIEIQTNQNNENKQKGKNIKPQRSYALCSISETGKIDYIHKEEIRQLLPKNAEMLLSAKNHNLSQFSITQNWRNIGLKIIDKLLNLKDSKWFKNLSEIRRINELGPDIPGVDLCLIRTKLQHHVYRSPKELREDINKIWINTKKRLGDTHEMTKNAIQLCTNFEHLAREYNYNSYIG